MKNSNTVEVINFIEKVDNEGKSISKFIEEFIVFLKDILLFKNTNICSDINDKKDKICELSNLLEDRVIYNMIYTYNDTLNNMKISSNPLILFVVSTLKIIKDNFNINKSGVDKYNSNNEKKTYINKKQEETVDKENNNVIVKEKVISDLKEIKKENSISEEFIDVRINNTFALANKNDLNDIKKNWNKINEYLLDSKYGVNCGILKDTDVVAAGDNYLILMSNFDSIVDKVNSKIDELENTLLHIFDRKYNIISLSNEEWLKEKEKYIVNIKSGIKYSLKEEIVLNNDIKKEKTPVDELIDIIGEDLVEIN